MTPMTVVPAHVAGLQDLLAARPEVVAAYVFGSTVTGAEDPGDVDLAVLFARAPDLRSLLDLQTDLERRAAVPVDLHDFDRLPVDLQFRVVREGVVLVDHHPATRVRREVRVLNDYNDFKPYLDRLRRAARSRLAAGARPRG
jgi:predicted nucleotidyltransferase